MPARMLRVGRSVWPARLAVLFTGCALLSAGTVGIAAPWWLQCAWLPVFYYCYVAVFRCEHSWLLNFGDTLQLRYYQSGAVQPLREQQGELLAQSQLCWFGIWLCWRNEQGRVVRRWLFQDAMPETDFRCLARQITQLRWHKPAAASGLTHWFR